MTIDDALYKSAFYLLTYLLLNGHPRPVGPTFRNSHISSMGDLLFLAVWRLPRSAVLTDIFSELEYSDALYIEYLNTRLQPEVNNK